MVEAEDADGSTTYRTISGYAWIDKSNTKNGQTNNLYDNGEQLVSGITVRLKNKSGSVVNTTTTDSNGAYKFSNVTGDVSEYYVEFDYSGTEYSGYAIVTPNYEASNGSKVTASDNDGIAVTYTGRDSTNESKYGLTRFYNSSSLSAENVNMGLIEVPDPGYSISETISYVEMTMNGYTYKYTYGGQGKVLATVPTVNWQGAQAYTRNIYPSDIIYNIENRTEALKINVVYRIDITNTENTNDRYRYIEKDLQITDLINTYDHDRYTLADSNWTETSGNAKINSNYLSKVNGSGLKSNETATAYITFKVNEKAIEDVLTNPEGITENKNIPTTATAHAYHNYERYVTYINSSTGEQEEKLKSYKTSDKPMNAVAYYLLFKLPSNPRTISGSIFEDVDEKDAEVLGNGRYESDKEGKISKVKVELLLSDKTTVSKLYKRSESGGTVYENGSLPNAEVNQTGEDGTYKFEGIIPGDYYLRFTYGDGSQVIKQVNGNTDNVYSSVYKSTIVTSGVTKTALETNYDATKALWYIDLEDKNYSIAVDNIEKRKDISNTDIDFASINSSYKNSSTAPWIYAETAMISIPIEYTKTSEGIGTTDYPSEFTGMNFGIIKMPEIDLKIDKEITNVKLTLSNLQVLFDGNPTSNMNYVASLDSNPNQAGGSGYVRAELDSNYIYGSTLLLTYGIKVTNNSDLTYVENESDGKYGWYYKYGDATYAHEAEINVTDVLDYLDPLLTKISSDDTNLEEILVSSLSDTDSFKKALLYLKEKQGIDIDFKNIYNFKSFGSLTSSKGSNVNSSSKILNLTASKLLSTDDDDLEFINYAQIVKAVDEKLTYKDPSPISDAGTLLEEIGALEMTQDSAKITITPPTGKNKSSINYIAVAIELIVLTTGIVIIKKKVIK